MKIYILRHAQAVPRRTAEYPNDDRPLTEDGIKKMERCAKGIAHIVPGFDVILTSPLVRASETAKITAKALCCEGKIEICRQLLPGASVKSLFSHLAKYRDRERMLLVGHEPDLGYIASALIGSETLVIEFKKGAICKIDISALPPKEPGKLIWHLPPTLLKKFGK